MEHGVYMILWPGETLEEDSDTVECMELTGEGWNTVYTMSRPAYELMFGRVRERYEKLLKVG